MTMPSASPRRFVAELPDARYWMERIPCQMACPVKTDAGRYVQLIAEGDLLSGYVVARSPNPFASVCGRVCAAPCEDACRRGKVDKPVSIRALKRFLTERYGVESLNPIHPLEIGKTYEDKSDRWPFHLSEFYELETRPKVGAGPKVAIIGAGPAGISCAHDLALMGYRVTIFEKSDRPGGMLIHGIPEFRLPRSIVLEEINQVLSLGVEIKYNAPLGPEFGLKELREMGFEAVFIAVGVQQGREMNVPGVDLDGVIKAVDFLININNGYLVNVGSRVLIIGGGLVAFDAARMALRTAVAQRELTEGELAELGGEQVGGMKAALDAARIARRRGAVDVYIASLESFEEMPALKTEQGREELEEALREGVKFLPRWGVKRFIGNGKLERVELVRVKRVFDEEGRFNPEYDEEIVEEFEADTAILAIGQTADLSFLKPEDGVEITPRKTIKVDPDSLRTTAEWVFAGGDVAFGPRNIIDAVADGKRAALSIDSYLRKREVRHEVHFIFEKLPINRYQQPEGYENYPRKAPPTVDFERRTGISEVEETYSPEEARRQAERCLSCHIQTVYNPDLCVMCNRCVDVCPTDCLKLVDLMELEILCDDETVRRLVEEAGASDGGPVSVMLKDDELCIRCGLCAIRCPTEAMTMEVMWYEEVEVPA